MDMDTRNRFTDALRRLRGHEDHMVSAQATRLEGELQYYDSDNKIVIALIEQYIYSAELFVGI